MAYATGTASNLQDLLTQLAAFMQANGWTLRDEPAAGDMVLTSSGQDGSQDMVYRLTTSKSANYPFLFAGNPHKAFDYLTVRGYGNWDPTTHVGAREFGYFGTILQTGSASDTGDTCFFRLEPTGTYPRLSTQISNNNFSRSGPYWNWDGRNKFLERYLDKNNTNLYIMDYNSQVSARSFSGYPQHTTVGCIVHNYATDKDYLYKLVDASPVVDQWRVYDVENDTWTKLPQPLWSSGVCTGATCCWDGGDFIYVMHGNDRGEFAKYQISTLTWTNLAAVPFNYRRSVWSAPSNSLGNNIVYLPASVTGLSEDVIYAASEVGDYSGSCNYVGRYDVTSNVWRTTTGAGAMGMPHGGLVGSSLALLYDGAKHLYLSDLRKSANIYRSDVTVNPTTWTNLGSHELRGNNFSWMGMSIIRTLVGKVRAHSVLVCKYHFIGDADGVTVVTQIASPGKAHTYWMRFGKFDTYYRKAVMTLTAPVTAGPRRVFTVNSTSGYIAGDSVTLTDASTGNIEQINIYDVPTENTFRANCTQNYGVGSRAAVVPNQHGITSDHGFFVTSGSAAGYQRDNEQDYYYVTPMFNTNGLDRASPSIRGQYVPTPFVVYHHTTTVSRYESLGTLSGVYALAKGAYPKPTEGDRILVGGKQYLVFNVTEQDLIDNNRYLLVAGPIN